MGERLHVLDVIFQHQQLAEPEPRADMPPGFLVTEKLGFEPFQAEITGNADQVFDQALNWSLCYNSTFQQTFVAGQGAKQLVQPLGIALCQGP